LRCQELGPPQSICRGWSTLALDQLGAVSVGDASRERLPAKRVEAVTPAGAAWLVWIDGVASDVGLPHPGEDLAGLDQPRASTEIPFDTG